MTDFERKALRVLVARTSLVRPAHFGCLLWPVKPGGFDHCGSAPLARPAGKVLNRLRALGYAEYVVEYYSSISDKVRDWGWRATTKGRQAAKVGT